MTRYVLLGLAFIFSSCSISADDMPMTLQSSTCSIQLDKGVLSLSLTPPCSWVSADKGRVDSWRYPDAGEVYIVAGSPAPLSQLDGYQVGEEDRCSLQGQYVFLRDNQVVLGKKIDGIVICPDIGLDEIYYRDGAK